MKQGGVSWNTSQKHKHGMLGKFVCSYCGRQYKQEWTRNNHQKCCEEFNKK